jgi:hypothetical protein
MVTSGGGSSRQPFRLGRGNKGGGADLMGQEERSRWHFVSPAHERGRVADGKLWHGGMVGQAAAVSGGWRSRTTPGWAGLGLVSVGMKEKQSGLSKDFAQFVNTLQKNGFQIYFKVLDLKYQRFQTLSNQI